MTDSNFPLIRATAVSAYTVPTTSPESDGTLEWNSTTIVVAEITAGDTTGLGFTYADRAAATLIEHTLAQQIENESPLDIPRLWTKLQNAIRGSGRAGVSAMAISAIDIALWDLKAKLLEVPVASLLGFARDSIDVYGSGGFTSYSDAQLRQQFDTWAADGFPAVKMKIGRHPADDLRRVRLAREIIGATCRLFVDANGAYPRKQALLFAEQFQDVDVQWFEEPVSSDDLDGLRLLRDRAPAGMDIAAGEYGYDSPYFLRMLRHGAVDVVQADATRCGGVSGFLLAAALADAFGVPLSAHTAPTLHAPLACAASRAVHVEYFHDHAMIETKLLDGVLPPQSGKLHPQRSVPGFGWQFRHADARPYRVQ